MITLLTDLDINNQTLLIREDLNVPMHNGKISSDARITAALPTIVYALKKGAGVVIMSHLGRPDEGHFSPEFSLQPVAELMGKLLGQTVVCVKDWHKGLTVSPGEVVILENVRFNVGEESNDQTLAKQYANLCDIFVMDAFATAHRAQASTAGVARFAKVSCAGPLLMAEVEALTRALEHPVKPMLAIVGGAKISSKLVVLESLLDKVNALIVGGGMANTFLAASGYSVGKSLVEQNLIPEAKALLEKAKRLGVTIPLAEDVVVSKTFGPDAVAEIKLLNDVMDDDMILDIGPKTIARFKTIIKEAKTIIWNGPVGVFEIPQFSHGTQAVANAVAESVTDNDAFSIVGGGDTLSAIHQFGVSEKISYISTGGSAFLALLEGKSLPGIIALERD